MALSMHVPPLAIVTAIGLQCSRGAAKRRKLHHHQAAILILPSKILKKRKLTLSRRPGAFMNQSHSRNSLRGAEGTGTPLPVLSMPEKKVTPQVALVIEVELPTDVAKIVGNLVAIILMLNP